MNSKKIIIMAGGTGGHVFPGLCIANYLMKKGWDVKWIGTENNIESKIVPEHGIKIYFIKIRGIRNSNLKNLIFSPIYILRSYFKIKKIIKNWSPDVVLGMGGYVSGPGGLAAWNSNIPLIIHEQNKISGITNQLLSKISTKNMQAFSGTLENADIVGNPVRENIMKIPPPHKRFKNRKGPLRVLVVGGSQGASILNEVLPEVSCSLKDKIIIWHQVGNYELEKTKKKYDKFGFKKYFLNCFIKNIDSAYAWADIIICRSGALTVSEISIVGLASIFIPYPHKDKQQHHNAKDLERIGSARIIDQSCFNSKLIIRILKSFKREDLLTMAEKAYSLGIRDSTLKIFKIIHKINNKK